MNSGFSMDEIKQGMAIHRFHALTEQDMSYVIQHGTGRLIQVNAHFKGLPDSQPCIECDSLNTYITDQVLDCNKAIVCMDCGSVSRIHGS